MKISIPNKLIKTAAIKGGVAAMTSEAKDKEKLEVQPTLDCIKIHVDGKNLVVESSVSQISSKFFMSLDEASNVEGECDVCFPIDWFINKYCEKVNQDSTMVLEAAPIEALSNDNGEVSHNYKVQVKSVGNKSKVKCETSAFSASSFVDTSYEEGTVVLSCKAGFLKKILDDVIFAANFASSSDFLDNVSIVRDDGSVLFGTCDSKRSVVKLVKDEALVAGKNGTSLVRVDLLSKASSVFDEDEQVVLMDSKDGRNAILKSSNLIFKIAMAPTNTRSKFPNIHNILKAETDFGLEISKQVLSEALDAAGSLNSETGEYFVQEGSDVLTVVSTKEGKGQKTEVTLELLGKVQKTLQGGHIFMSTQFLQEIVKRIPGDKIKISFSSDERKIKVEDPNDPNYVCIMMRMLERKAI